ncbi:hypothetical protein LMG29542_07829 [Paraburkholderia humisilvae]|uniref:Tc1-like transposase DDE domain-containing protein n=1 Tax=Paraburkholderia humisilvae TaxID=627669 RepID=A0A6J5F9Y1_9BURK|nr:hypothetical protein LMG29542_07829 [Paraburkholderia humisilvae]
MSAACAVNPSGAFGFAMCEGGLSGELFVTLSRQLMFNRKKAVHLIVDGLPAHKKVVVRDYVASTWTESHARALLLQAPICPVCFRLMSKAAS